MSKQLFTGEAKGLFDSSPSELYDKALLQAIEKAKETLPTSLVAYEVVARKGEYGGFADVHNVYVTIEAGAPKNE
ncbi:MAG: hypothetical protein NXI10_15925 [bacterium]|nr:hypothetical protein [bacterium]